MLQIEFTQPELVRVSIVVKRHNEHGNSSKGKYLIGMAWL